MKRKTILSLLGMSFAMALGVIGGLKLGEKAQVKEADAAGTVEYRFTNNYSWKYIKAYAFVSTDETQNNNWNTGGEMSEAYVNESGQQVYTVSLDSKYDRLVFHGRNYDNNADVQTVNIEVGSNHGFYCTGWDNGNATVGNYNLSSTYYLYDYDNKFGGTVSVYGWNNANNTINNSHPGVAATRLTNIAANGTIYSISLDVKYNRLQWNIGNNGLEVNAGQPTNSYCYIYDPDSHITNGPTKGTWNNNLNYVVAHNWWANLMNFRNVTAEAGEGADGTTCESMYTNAKNSYEGMNEYMQAEINNSYHEALERMVKWAEHHHKTFTLDNEGIGTFSTSNSAITAYSINKNSNDVATIIIVISTLSIASLGLFLFLKKRKEDR